MSVDDPHNDNPAPSERPIGQVRGTRDWLPADSVRLGELEARLLARFARAGYEPMRTPVLEFTELHERKSGAGIVAKLFELANGVHNRLCLRPELTASIVRAYTDAADSPSLPWRVSMSGPVFRYEKDPQVAHYREFQQVGVEMLGASGPEADAEIIALAAWTAADAGIPDVLLRLGHVGLILEMLERSGLPTPAQSALVEMLSEAAAEGRGVRALEAGLEQLAQWLRSSAQDEFPPPLGGVDDGGVDRLFRTLVPDVTGRRSGREILVRLRRKWELGHSLHGVLDRLRDQIHELAELRGPLSTVLDRLKTRFREQAPESIKALADLETALGSYSLDANRIELDLGFGRGIGFYSQMVFELVAPTPTGPVEVCGGGRYDGLARVLGSDRDDRGIGFAFGLERLQYVLDARGASRTKDAASGFLVLARQSASAVDGARIAFLLQQQGARAVLDAGRAGEAALARARELNVAQIITPVGSFEDPRALRVRDVATAAERTLSIHEAELNARADAEGRRL